MATVKKVKQEAKRIKKPVDAQKELAKVKKMAKIAQKMLNRAYVPYSNFRVGACVEAENGDLFGGCNIENASYGITLCAECTAISALIASGETRIKSALVMGLSVDLCTPCGRCRQLIREFAALDTPIYLCDQKGNLQKTVTLDQLLPLSFGPEHLGK